jgi:hypothetical protein
LPVINCTKFSRCCCDISSAVDYSAACVQPRRFWLEAAPIGPAATERVPFGHGARAQKTAEQRGTYRTADSPSWQFSSDCYTWRAPGLLFMLNGLCSRLSELAHRQPLSSRDPAPTVFGGHPVRPVPPRAQRSFSGMRQPSCDGTSRMMREYHVRNL